MELRVSINFKEIKSGIEHTLGIDIDGRLWTWGLNGYGQLGDGTKESRKNPVIIKEDSRFVQISTKNNLNGAIDEMGNLWAWGINIGVSPAQIGRGIKFKQISVGDEHFLAIDEMGNLWAFGKNEYGQIGDGTKIDKYYLVQIKEGTKFTQIAAGSSSSYAIDEIGNLWAWGGGIIGDGTDVGRYYPVQIKEGTKFMQISAGSGHCLAIDELENLWAWGSSSHGQVGNGVSGIWSRVTSPVQIKEGTKFKQISCNTYHSLAIDEIGNLWAWGRNDKYGGLGDGTKIDRSYPVQIKEGTKFKQISAGVFNSFATDEFGNLWAWGFNTYGMLGDGTTTNRLTPIQIN